MTNNTNEVGTAARFLLPQADQQGRALDLRASLARLRQDTSTAWLRGGVLGVLDAALIALAWFLAIRWGSDGVIGQPLQLLPPIVALSLGLMAAAGLYGPDGGRRNLWNLARSLTLSLGILVWAAFVYRPGLEVLSRSTLLLGWLLSIVLAGGGRLLVDGAIDQVRRLGMARRSIFLIGTPEDTEPAIRHLQDHRRYKVLGRADVLDVSRNWDALLGEIRRLGVAEVFVCSWPAVSGSLSLYWSLKAAGIGLRILPGKLDLPRQPWAVSQLGSLPTIEFTQPSIVGIDFRAKRCFDIAIAALILIAASPLYLFIGLLVRLDSPGPIFYRQTRIGLKGRRFQVWKFRTMVVDAERLQQQLEARNESNDGILFKLKDDPRITRIGHFLRRYSLDELPQIFNVLVGEMSLVGPRPFPLRDVERFSARHFVRQEVLPGITGLWQVSGRSNIVDFEEVLRLDLSYIQNWSLALDFEILLRTVRVVLRREGAY